MSDLTRLSFTPHHALGGGVLLGVAVVGKLVLSGRVLGVSGAFKGLVSGKREPWRVAFVGGLCAAGACARALGALDDGMSARMVDAARASVAGALVGFGTAMGRGCTSGHGIVGNSRLSLRSMAYTLTFMVSGAVVATVMGTNAAVGVDSATHVLGAGATLAESDDVELWMRLGAASAAAFAAAAFYIKRSIVSGPKDEKGETVSAKKRHAIDVAVDGAAGLVFGLGLAVSGMMSPAKVSGFLSVTEASWDPSLMFVMGGAMAVTMLGMRLSGAHAPHMHKPTCSYNNFDFATNKNVDRPLLLGGVLFGAGWGLAGVCPGPAVVSAVANPSAEIGAWLLAFLAGMWAHETFA